MAKVIKVIQPPIDYSIIAPFVHQWVALTKDRKKVIAADPDGKKLMKKLDKMENLKSDDVVLHFVLDIHQTYSF